MKTAVEFYREELNALISLRESNFKTEQEIFEQAKEIEKEQQSKLWTNEEVFDMLYKTDKFLMIHLREYWKTIKK